ncbi:MAG: VanZ family protein [Bacillota bacterium]|nr:VanZ family protein [Bacillota bacterium]
MQIYITKLIDKLYNSLFDPRYLIYWISTVLIFVFVYLLLKKNKKDKITSFSISFIVAYYFMVYAYTVLSRYTDTYSIQLVPLWSYIDVLFHHSKLQLLMICINLAMLFPIGFLIPFGFKKWKWYHVLLVSTLLSYMVEFSQLLLHKGTFELFDDPINNILGCMIGYCIGKWVYRKCIKRS